MGIPQSEGAQLVPMNQIIGIRLKNTSPNTSSFFSSEKLHRPGTFIQTQKEP